MANEDPPKVSASREAARALLRRNDLNPTFSIGPLSLDGARGLLHRGTGRNDLGQQIEDSLAEQLADPNFYISALVHATRLGQVVDAVPEILDDVDLAMEASKAGSPPGEIAALLLGQTLGTNQLQQVYQGTDRHGHALSEERKAELAVEGWFRLVRAVGIVSEGAGSAGRLVGETFRKSNPSGRQPSLRAKSPKAALPDSPELVLPESDRLTTARTGVGTAADKLGASGKPRNGPSPKSLEELQRRRLVPDLSREGAYEHLGRPLPESQPSKPTTSGERATGKESATKRPSKVKRAVKRAKTPKPPSSWIKRSTTPKTVEIVRGTVDRFGATPTSKPDAPAATSTPANTQQAERPVRRGEPFNKSIAERLIDAEQALAESRERTSEYFREREAAKKSRKGGPKKGIDNAKEAAWKLRRQLAYPDRQILDGCEVTGLRRPSGEVLTMEDLGLAGREPDFIEIKGQKANLGELKSEWELDKSLRIKKSGGGIEASVDPKSKLGGQWELEDKLLREARKEGSRVMVRGYDVRTGLRVEGEFEAQSVTHTLNSTTAGGNLGSEYEH